MVINPNKAGGGGGACKVPTKEQDKGHRQGSVYRINVVRGTVGNTFANHLIYLHSTFIFFLTSGS